MKDKLLEEYNRRQIRAIEHHKYMLGTRLGRCPSSYEVCISWVEDGLAIRFASGEFDESLKNSENKG